MQIGPVGGESVLSGIEKTKESTMEILQKAIEMKETDAPQKMALPGAEKQSEILKEENKGDVVDLLA